MTLNFFIVTSIRLNEIILGHIAVKRSNNVFVCRLAAVIYFLELHGKCISEDLKINVIVSTFYFTLI